MSEPADPNRLPSILVIGFPKSGTTTLQRAFTESGLVSAHWKWGDRPVGRMIYNGWFEEGDPLARLRGIDAITQMDYCLPRERLNLWPNLDIALLLAIRRLHPGTKFILNDRPAEATADSFARWSYLGGMVPRITRSNITGLPAGRGRKQEELIRWIESHQAALREIFAGSPDFLDLDITAKDAKEQLSAFIGRPVTWWGVANANPASGETAPDAAPTETQKA